MSNSNVINFQQWKDQRARDRATDVHYVPYGLSNDQAVEHEDFPTWNIPVPMRADMFQVGKSS